MDIRRVVFSCLGIAFPLCFSCTPDIGQLIMPAGDIRPPSVLWASQENPAEFLIRFDETVTPVERSFSFLPASSAAMPYAQGQEIGVRFSPSLPPGEACTLSGEAEDGAGNSTRFIFSFVGYNDRPVPLRITEVQTGKNTSASNNHRDFIELLALEAGNLGGVCIKWSSSVKDMKYIFPPCEVDKGEYLVLHCAPEGIQAEKDEVTGDMALSGGIDSNLKARDFWTLAGGLADETGVIAVSPREGASVEDGFFYVALGKSGEVDSAKLKAALALLHAAGRWSISPEPLWEDGFLWKPSTSRSIVRKGMTVFGKESWEVGEPGEQSPGSPFSSIQKSSQGRGKTGSKTKGK
jgi:hypothetical protein